MIDLDRHQPHCYICSGFVHDCLLSGNLSLTLLSIALGSVINPCPLVALFGLSPKNTKLSSLHKSALAFSTLIARQLILLNWKFNHSRTHINWVRDLITCIHLEKIRYLRDVKQGTFVMVWGPFISHLSSLSAAGITPILPSAS